MYENWSKNTFPVEKNEACNLNKYIKDLTSTWPMMYTNQLIIKDGAARILIALFDRYAMIFDKIYKEKMKTPTKQNKDKKVTKDPKEMTKAEKEAKKAENDARKAENEKHKIDAYVGIMSVKSPIEIAIASVKKTDK